MDDDIAEDADLKKEVEAEIRRRKRAIAKAEKAEEDRKLIVAAEGKVSVKYRITITKYHLQGLGKRRKKRSKMPASIFHLQSIFIKNIYVSMVRGTKKKKTSLTEC
jgi:hypothetical protein